MGARYLKAVLEAMGDHVDGLKFAGGPTQGPRTTNRYIEDVVHGGFDILEISSGFITIPTDDILRLVERVQRPSLKAKPDIGIQFSAGDAAGHEELAHEGALDVGYVIVTYQEG